jgi:hypothetical protein
MPANRVDRGTVREHKRIALAQRTEAPMSLAVVRPWSGLQTSGLVEVEFLHTGIDSNWHVYLEEVGRRPPLIDGVVLSCFIRTTFGRRVRRDLGPRAWRTCIASGRQGFERMIAEVAKAVDTQRRRAVGG